MLELDHVAVLGSALGEAVGHVEHCLQKQLVAGGQHAHFATHNRLLGLEDGLYLEAIAIDPSVPAPPYPRWFGLDSFAGPARLDKWIVRTNDMQATLEAFPQAGHPVALERDGLRWTMAVPEDGTLPFDGLFPAIIQWHSAVPPGQSLASSGVRLKALHVQHPRAQDLEHVLSGMLTSPVLHFEPAEVPGLKACMDVDGNDVWLS
ncbi:MAG: VOC family protein [Rhodobacteraceae bacterium]|nr:VOC family protein [Paracoccaceae bacterium]